MQSDDKSSHGPLEWSSTKFVIFVPITYPRWPPQGNNSLPLNPMITNLVEDLPMNISAKFGPNLFIGFREEDKNMKSLQTRMTTTDTK
jgi:hypothetical protein